MNDPLDTARALWRDLWRGECLAWSPDAAAFLPFDALATLTRVEEIEAHWRERRVEYRLVADDWRPVAEWTVTDTRIVVAEVTAELEHRGRVERRMLTLTVAHSLATPPRVRHLGEAAPAALLLVLAGYEAEAGRTRG